LLQNRESLRKAVLTNCRLVSSEKYTLQDAEKQRKKLSLKYKSAVLFGELRAQN
jgi:hypothetical protein